MKMAGGSTDCDSKVCDVCRPGMCSCKACYKYIMRLTIENIVMRVNYVFGCSTVNDKSTIW